MTGNLSLSDASSSKRTFGDAEHPCNRWAASAGYADWDAAIDAMEAGKVIRGSLFAIQPSHSKSMRGMNVFMNAVVSESLHSLLTAEGSFILGFKANFPPEV